jgi:predicted transcriptional regulator of viral defense system
VQRQLSRWSTAERLYQLRRGLYAVAPPFQKVKPHLFLVANRMVQPSFVSLQSALAYYSLIPDYAFIGLSNLVFSVCLTAATHS